MTAKTQAIKGSLILMLGQGLVYGSSFARNMILARILTKADFGIQATFSMVITLLEFSAKLGIGQFVVRDKEGDKPEFIASTQLVLFLVAVLSSVFIVVSANPLSTLFGIPGQRGAIMLLALVSLFRGVEHLDVRRFERHLRFIPSLLVEAVPQVIITLAAWPVAYWLRDYRAVVVLLLTKGLATCVWTHLVAEQPYRWRLHHTYIVRTLDFGWPLLVNGFLLFAVAQGDQFLIASSYTMVDLAPYAAAAAVTMAPTFFFGRVFNSVMLPVLAKVQDDPAAFARRYRQVLAMVTVFAIVCSFGMILGGEVLMRLVYGAKYGGTGVLLGWLSASNAFKTLRIAPALAALAKGDSQNQMISNFGRVVALVPAAGLALTKQPLWTVACCGLLGEAVACWISIVRLRRRDDIPFSTSLIPAAWALASLGGAGALVALGFYRLPAIVGLSWTALGVTVVAGVMIAVIPELRSEVCGLCVCHSWMRWGRCLTTSQAIHAAGHGRGGQKPSCCLNAGDEGVFSTSLPENSPAMQMCSARSRRRPITGVD